MPFVLNCRRRRQDSILQAKSCVAEPLRPRITARPWGAESRREFVHKLKVVLKELNETGVWLRIIRRSKMLPSARVVPIKQECDELCKIISTSIKTTIANQPGHKSKAVKAGITDG